MKTNLFTFCDIMDLCERYCKLHLRIVCFFDKLKMLGKQYELIFDKTIKLVDDVKNLSRYKVNINDENKT